MVNEETIAAARRSLRIRETLLIVLAFLFPASMLLAGIPLSWLLRTYAPVGIMAAVYGVLILAAAWWRQQLRCPRCGERFFSAGRPLAHACRNCGLEMVR